MIIFPAIDIRGGKCVRLLKGDFAKETVFSDKPEEMAKKWQAQGAEFLHLVDLDGALAGKPQNLATVKAILAAVDIPVELNILVKFELFVIFKLFFKLFVFFFDVIQMILPPVLNDKGITDLSARRTCCFSFSSFWACTSEDFQVSCARSSTLQDTC